MLTDMLLLPNKEKEASVFLGIMHYWGKLLHATAYVCEPLRRLTSTKAESTWNSITKSYMRKWRPSSRMMWAYESTMKKHVCLEIDALYAWLGTGILRGKGQFVITMRWSTLQKVLFPITFSSKSLTSTERSHNIIENEALGMLHAVEKFHLYLSFHPWGRLDNRFQVISSQT